LQQSMTCNTAVVAVCCSKASACSACTRQADVGDRPWAAGLANLLSGAALICGPRRDRSSWPIIP
jgi:hypothetical protein